LSDHSSVLSGATVIFDLDGTLVDTAPDLVRALNAVIEADGFPATPIEDVRAMVGRGAKALLRRAYARSGTALPEPHFLDRHARFLDVYAAGIAELSQPFPGAEAAVEGFAAAGARCVMATNKPQALTDLLLGELGWTDRFSRVVGADACPAKKPHAAHLEAAAGGAEALGRAVMIGDSAVDVAAARAAGVPVIALSHGYSETPFERLGADRVLAGFDGVIDAAAALIAARA
jgi:phosphoglycolate phosphatase